MLGVMIHGAIRNITVSVKMGVRGISWAWEREGIRKSGQGTFHACFLKRVKLITILHLLSTCGMSGPGVVPHVPFHFCLTATPGGRCYYNPYLTGRETESQTSSHRPVSCG